MGSIRQKTLDDLAWSALTAHLASRCHTERGSSAARELPFAADPGAARARLGEVSEARLLHALEAPLPMGGIRGIDEPCARVEKGGDLVGAELVWVGETVAACARLRRHVAARAEAVPRLWEIAQAVSELSHVSGPILESFEEGARLADHASAALGPMRRRVAQLHDELARRARELLDDPGIAPYLQDRFYTQREERYVVPLRADSRARIPGIVHGTSQSGQTVFVEPQVMVDLNNRLKIAESDLAEEERRILAELSALVREEVARIRVGIEVAARLDVIDGAARLADDLGAAEPVVTEIAGGPAPDEPPPLALRQARHPLMVLAGRPCVPNDVELAAGTTLVVSGPNAGGKTVALKTVGLAALMTRAGLHVAADAGSRVPFFEVIETDIGDDQSLERNLSTFSAHVMNVIAFLSSARPGALLLVDEVAVGTDPEQGAALAQAILEAWASRGAQAIVTTHYERLKAMATRDARFVNASVGFDLERMAPTFELHLGVPGSSGALWVTRRLGLAPPVVARAEELLGDRRTGVEELLAAVAEERRRIAEERAVVERTRREAAEARREAEEAERRARQRTEELRRGAHDEAVAALRRARDEADRARTRMKQASRAELAASRAELAAIGERISGHAPPAAIAGRPAAVEELIPGARVLVARLGGIGVVVAPPDRGRVIVQVGGLRASAAIEDVRIDREAPRARRARGAGGAPPPAPARIPDDDVTPMRTGENSLDLRGERVDDALARVDQFLDDALLASRDVVFVIHGHGTGALKGAIRDHLDLHAAVARWRPGTEKEGGDGATVVWLDV